MNGKWELFSLIFNCHKDLECHTLIKTAQRIVYPWVITSEIKRFEQVEFCFFGFAELLCDFAYAVGLQVPAQEDPALFRRLFPQKAADRRGKFLPFQLSRDVVPRRETRLEFVGEGTNRRAPFQALPLSGASAAVSGEAFSAPESG